MRGGAAEEAALPVLQPVAIAAIVLLCSGPSRMMVASTPEGRG